MQTNGDVWNIVTLHYSNLMFCSIRKHGLNYWCLKFIDTVTCCVLDWARENDNFPERATPRFRQPRNTCTAHLIRSLISRLTSALYQKYPSPCIFDPLPSAIHQAFEKDVRHVRHCRGSWNRGGPDRDQFLYSHIRRLSIEECTGKTSHPTFANILTILPPSWLRSWSRSLARRFVAIHVFPIAVQRQSEKLKALEQNTQFENSCLVQDTWPRSCGCYHRRCHRLPALVLKPGSTSSKHKVYQK
jgi:hypothetical protein